MEHLLVYPANGWWRIRPYLDQFNRRIRYSLVVSIESRGLDIDLYTPIETTIAQTLPSGEVEIKALGTKIGKLAEARLCRRPAAARS